MVNYVIYCITKITYIIVIDFDNVGVCLLSSDSLKLTEKFLEVDLFCVVVDDFDIVATKPLVKKLNGSYNIGLTKRNFYVSEFMLSLFSDKV